ncbi:MAG: hypothetical protein HYY18_16340 [Planctomycetes bacterium]|nr:hypothetical protein [Planctomycetota bacterium]
MKRASLFALIAALTVLPRTARSEDPRPALPAVWESEMADCDIGALAAGDWAEYELAGPMWIAPAAGKKPSRRLACVAADEEGVWVEVTHRNVSPATEGLVLALRVRRADRKVTRAVWAKPGEAGTEAEVKPGAPGEGVPPPGGPPKVTGTGTAAKEKLKAGTTALDCEKVELETVIETSCCEIRTRTTTWVSEKVPFVPWVDDPPRVSGIPAQIEWKSKPAVKGGLVKRSVFRENQTTTVTLVRWGRDAKGAVKLPPR